MKKIYLIVLSVFLILGITSNVSAMSYSENNENTVVEDETISWDVYEEPIEQSDFLDENYGLSYTNPDPEIVLFGTSRPTKVWDISSKGQYDFGGSTHGQTLYTNYKFKGKTSYTIKINNTGKNTITVKAKRLTKTYATTKVSGGKSATIQFSDIKKDTEFYITFDGSNIAFNGYVK